MQNNKNALTIHLFRFPTFASVLADEHCFVRLIVCTGAYSLHCYPLATNSSILIYFSENK